MVVDDFVAGAVVAVSVVVGVVCVATTVAPGMM